MILIKNNFILTNYISIAVLVIFRHSWEVRCKLWGRLQVQVTPGNGIKEGVLLQWLIPAHLLTSKSLGWIQWLKIKHVLVLHHKIPVNISNTWMLLTTYQELFNKILGFGKEFLWKFIFQLYYLLEYKVFVSTIQTYKRSTHVWIYILDGKFWRYRSIQRNNVCKHIPSSEWR